MPATLEKIANGKYRVHTPEGVTAKGTTKRKAEGQRRLLEGLAHGLHPRGKKIKKG